jgi:hypothetical protein
LVIPGAKRRLRSPRRLGRCHRSRAGCREHCRSEDRRARACARLRSWSPARDKDLRRRTPRAQRDNVHGLRPGGAGSSLELEPVARGQRQPKITGEGHAMNVEILTASVSCDVSVTARPVEPFDGPAERDVLLSIASNDRARAANVCRAGRSTDRSTSIRRQPTGRSAGVSGTPSLWTRRGSSLSSGVREPVDVHGFRPVLRRSWTA